MSVFLSRTARLLAVFFVLALPLFFLTRASTPAYAATSDNLNFQARLESASGAIAPDGNYNVEFKLYDASTGGTLLWTETRTSTNKVRVANGYLTVNLGDVTSFPSNMPWDQQLYLTMNIGGTGSPSWDGEMSPRLKLTAVPYAFNAKTASQLATSSGSALSTLSIQAPTSGYNQSFIIPDQGAAGTYNILTAPNGSDGYVKLQTGTPGTQQAGNFNINGAGIVGGLLQGGTLRAGSSQQFQVDASGNVTTSGSLNTGSSSLLTVGGATLNSTLGIGDLATGGNIGSAATTVDIYTNFTIAQTTAGQTLTIPAPTSTTTGRLIYITNVGSAGYNLGGSIASPGTTMAFVWNSVTSAWTLVSSGTSGNYIQNGTAIQTANFNVQSYSASSVTATIQGANSQSANILEVKAAGVGTPLFSVGPSSISAGTDMVLAAGKSITITGGNTASRPASPTEGMVYYDTTTHQLLQYNGSKWVSDRSDVTKIVAASNSSQAVKDAADYVADGTGDQVEINAALTAASGGKVYLAEGTYTLSGSISVPNNTTLAGAGAGTIITIPNAFNANLSAIVNTDTTTGTNITVRDLKLDGNRSNQSGSNFGMAGIAFTGVGDNGGGSRPGATITNIQSINWDYSGSVSGCNEGIGICMFDSGNSNITDNTVNSNSSTGIYINDSTKIILSGNILSYNSNTSLNLAGVTDSTLTNNVVTGSSWAINLDVSSYNLITGNTVINSGYATDNDAIHIAASDANTITGNTITDSSCTTTCYAINISNSTSDSNYLSNNTLGGGTVNDAGTGTIYGGQSNGTSYLIQPAQNITIGSASTTTTIQGSTKVTPQSSTSTTLLCSNAGIISTCDASVLAPTASNFVQFAPATAQTDATNNASIYINKTSATGNILQLQKSGNNVLVVDNGGNVGIGGTPTARLSVVDSQSLNSGNAYTATITQTFKPTTTNYSTFATGLNVVSQLDATTAVDTSTVDANIRGIYAEAPNWSSKNIYATYGVTGASGIGGGSNGSINNAYGLQGYIYQNGTGTITNAFGNFSEIRSTGAGTIQNAIGFYGETTKSAGNINSYTLLKAGDYSSVVGAGNQYGVLTYGKSRFGDNTLPTEVLEVAGNISVDSGNSYKIGGVIAMEASGNYLRINQNNQFSQGIYTGTSGLRVGGTTGIIVGSTGADGQIGIIPNGVDTTRRITLDGGTGAVTAIGVNSGTGLLQGTGGLTVTGTTSINGSGTAATSIGVGSTGTVTIGNGSTGAIAIQSGTSIGLTAPTTITGNTSINTTGSGTTTIGSTSGGAVGITANAASSFTTNTGALTLTSAAAATWSTTAGLLTLQGAGGVSVLTATAATSSAITIQTGNSTAGTAAAVTIDTGTSTSGSGTINIATTNAGTVNISRTGAATNVNGSLTVAQTVSLNGNTTIGDATTDRLTVTSQILGGSPLVFQGATDNGFTTTLAVTDPTANNTITLPNASGTVLLAPSGSGNGLVQVPSSNTAGVAGANVISPTTDWINGLTINGTTGTNKADALIVTQAGTGVNAATIRLQAAGALAGTEIKLENASGTTSAGLLISRNTAGGTTTAGINVNNSAGTMTSGISVDNSATITNGLNIASSGAGTMTTALLINNSSGTITNGISFSGTIGTDITTATGRNLNIVTATTGQLNLDTGSTGAINIGTNANAKTVTIGNTTGASIVNIQGGTGTAAGDINIGDTTVAGKIIDIGSVTNAATSTIRIATAAAVQTVTVGSTNSTSTTTIQAGANGANTTLALQAASGGVITMGSQTAANTINVGTVGTAAFSSTVNVGTSTGAAQTVNIGSTNSTSTTNIYGGTGNINLLTNSATSNVIVKSQTNGTGAFQVQNSSNTPLINANTSNMRVGIGAASATSTLSITNATAGDNSLYIQNAASQTGSSIRIQNSSSQDLYRVYSDGSLEITNQTTDSESSIRVITTSTNTLFNVNSRTGFITLNGTKDATNDLLQDGGFEGGSSYVWGATEVTSGNGIYNDSVNSRNGNRHLRIGGSGGNVDVITQQWFAVKPGDTVYAEGYVKSASGNGDAGLFVEFRDKDKLNPAYANAFTGTPGATYELRSVSSTVPAGKTFARVVVTKRSNATAGTYYFDDIYFTATNQRAPFTFKNTTDSANAFQIQNSTGTNLFNVDTTSRILTIGSQASTSTVNIGTVGSAAFSSTVNIATSTGAAQTINIGSSASSTNIQSNTTYFGTSGGAIVLQATAQSTAGATGNSMTIKAGTGGSGNANGGTLTLSGGDGTGTGVTGLVSLNPTTFAASSTVTLSSTTNLNALLTNAVNLYSTVPINATATGYTLTVNLPTVTTVGRVLYISAVNGSSDFTLLLGGTSVSISMKANSTATLIYNGTGWTAAGASSSTDLQAAYNNTLTSAGGAELVLNAPGGNADGLTIRNNSTPITGALFEVQSSIATSLFSVNNNTTEYAVNGGAENSTFTGWSNYNSGVAAKSTAAGTYATGVAGVAVTTSGTNQGTKNTLSTTLSAGVYVVSFAAKVASGTNTFNAWFSSNGTAQTATCDSSLSGSGYTITQNFSVTTSWTKVSCFVTVPAGATATNAILIANQSNTSFYIDNLSVISNASTTTPANVQIGGGATGGQPTLFTLDQFAGPPMTTDNPAYYGSMYYDTTKNAIQCYQYSSGSGGVWGACGSAPDDIISMTPEYTGAVLNGTGVGTMTSDFCSNESGVLVTPASGNICANHEARNFYKWTSPQPTAQTYGIYVTYKLPSTFKAFKSGTMSLTGLIDSTSNAAVKYAVFRKAAAGTIYACSADTSNIGSASTWTAVSPTTDISSSSCGTSGANPFVAGDTVIIRVTVSAQSNANAYVENLTFQYSNK